MVIVKGAICQIRRRQSTKSRPAPREKAHSERLNHYEPSQTLFKGTPHRPTPPDPARLASLVGPFGPGALTERGAAGKLAVGAAVEWYLSDRASIAAPAPVRVRVSRDPFPLSPARLPEVAAGAIAVELDAAVGDAAGEQVQPSG